MKRIKSAPANIAEMVNRKKPTFEKKPEKTILFIIQKKQIMPITKHQHQLVPLKNQKIIERTFNTIMIDYINDKQLLNNNDEEAFILSILYYYFCEKIFTKNNMREFMIFITQTLVKYIFTHILHDVCINNKDIIIEKLMLTQHINHL
jgi:hypothetical protein